MMGDMTYKNRNKDNFNYFFKLKEKDKIPSKTPYLDKIWNFSNNSNLNPKANTKSKENTKNPLQKQNSQEIKEIKLSNTNIKNEGDKKKELIEKRKDKKGNVEKKQGEKIEGYENIRDKNIFSEKKERKMNIIFNILNKPFFCCLK